MKIDSGLTLNIARQMKKLKTEDSKSLEKLSSGLRINRAADDAAGLSISEKMRAQIRGLRQAARNAQDGISVVQTAEGAMDEVHRILERMRQLAVQSANDSNTDVDERVAMQQEIDQLTDEIERISGTTQFNTMNLLDGTFKNKQFHIGSNMNQNLGIDIENIGIDGLGLHSGSWQRIEDPEKKALLKVQATLTTDVRTVQGPAGSKQQVELRIGNDTKKFSFEVGTTAQQIVDEVNRAIENQGKATLNGSSMEISLRSVGIKDAVYLIKLDSGTSGGIVSDMVSADIIDNNSKGEPPKPAELVVSNIQPVGGAAGQTQEITVNIDGKNYNVSLTVGDDANTVASKIQSAIGGAGTAEIVGGNLVIKSTSEGEDSRVSIVRQEINNTTGGITETAPVTITQGTDGVPPVPGTQGYAKIPNVTAVGAEGYQEITIDFTRLAKDGVTVESKTFSDIKLTANMTLNQIVTTINSTIAGWGTASIDSATGELTIKTAQANDESTVKITRNPVDVISNPGVAEDSVTGALATKAKVSVAIADLDISSGYQELKISINGGAAKIVKLDNTLDVDASGKLEINEIAEQIQKSLGTTANVTVNGSNIEIESAVAGGNSKVVVEKVINNATGGISANSVPEDRGVTGVAEVVGQTAKASLTINDIGADGFQELDITIVNGDVSDVQNPNYPDTDARPTISTMTNPQTTTVKVVLKAGSTTDDIRAAVQTAIGSAGTVSGTGSELIINSKTAHKDSTIKITRSAVIASPGGIATNATASGSAGDPAIASFDLANTSGGYQDIQITINGTKVTDTNGSDTIRIQGTAAEIASKLDGLLAGKGVTTSFTAGKYTIKSDKLGSNQTITVERMPVHNVTGGITTTTTVTGAGENVVPATPATTTITVGAVGATGYQEIDVTVDGTTQRLRLEQTTGGQLLASSVNKSTGAITKTLGQYTNDATGIRNAVQAIVGTTADITGTGADLTITARNSTGTNSSVGIKRIEAYTTSGGIDKTNTLTDTGEDATKAILQKDLGTITTGSGVQEYTLTIDGNKTVTFRISPDDNETTIQTNIQKALTAAGSNATVSVSGGKLTVTSGTAGANSSVALSAPKTVDTLENGVTVGKQTTSGVSEVKASVTTGEIGKITEADVVQTVTVTYKESSTGATQTFKVTLDNTNTNSDSELENAFSALKSIANVSVSNGRLTLEEINTKDGSSFEITVDKSLGVSGGITDATIDPAKNTVGVAAKPSILSVEIKPFVDGQGALSYDITVDNNPAKTVVITKNMTEEQIEKAFQEAVGATATVTKNSRDNTLEITTVSTGQNSKIIISAPTVVNKLENGVIDSGTAVAGHTEVMASITGTKVGAISEPGVEQTVTITYNNGTTTKTYDVKLNQGNTQSQADIAKAFNDVLGTDAKAEVAADGTLTITETTAYNGSTFALSVDKNIGVPGGITDASEGAKTIGEAATAATGQVGVKDLVGNSGRQKYTVTIDKTIDAGGNVTTTAANSFEVIIAADPDGLKTGAEVADEIAAALNSDANFANVASASANNGNLVITSKTLGKQSFVSISAPEAIDTIETTEGVNGAGTAVDGTNEKAATLKTQSDVLAITGDSSQPVTITYSDGKGTTKTYTVTLDKTNGSTPTDIIKAINGATDGGTGKLSDVATASLQGGKLLLTAKTPQAGSSFELKATSLNMTGGLNGASETGAVTGKDATKAVLTKKITLPTGDSGVLTYTVTIDGAHTATVELKAGMSEAEIEKAFSDAIGKYATVDTAADGNLKITSNLAGANSKVEISGPTTTNELSGLIPAGTISDTDGIASNYTKAQIKTPLNKISEGSQEVDVIVDGTAYSVTLDTTNAGTAISNADITKAIAGAKNSSGELLSSVADVSFDGTNLTITHNTAGANTLEIKVTNQAATGGIDAVPLTKGTDATAATTASAIVSSGNLTGESGIQRYTITVTGNNAGTAVNQTITIDINPSAAGKTMTDIVNELNSKSGNHFTAVLDGGNIKITSAYTGANSSVKVDVQNVAAYTNPLVNDINQTQAGVTEHRAKIMTGYVLKGITGNGTQTFDVITTDAAGKKTTTTINLEAKDLGGGTYGLSVNDMISSINSQLSAKGVNAQARISQGTASGETALDAGKLVIELTGSISEGQNIALDYKPQDTTGGITDSVISNAKAGETHNTVVEKTANSITVAGQDFTAAQLSMTYTPTAGTTGVKTYTIELNKGVTTPGVAKTFDFTIGANQNIGAFVDAINTAYKAAGGTGVIASVDPSNSNNVLLVSDLKGAGSTVKITEHPITNITTGGLNQTEGIVTVNQVTGKNGTSASMSADFYDITNVSADSHFAYEVVIGNEKRAFVVQPKLINGKYSVTGDMIVEGIQRMMNNSPYASSLSVTSSKNSDGSTRINLTMKPYDFADVTPTIGLNQLDSIPLGSGEGVGARRAKTKVTVMDTKTDSSGTYTINVHVNGKDYKVTGGAGESLDTLMQHFKDAVAADGSKLGDVAFIYWQEDLSGKPIEFTSMTWSNSQRTNIEKLARSLVIESKEASEYSVVSVSRGSNKEGAGGGGQATGAVAWDTLETDTKNYSRGLEEAIVLPAIYKNGLPSLFGKSFDIYIDGKKITRYTAGSSSSKIINDLTNLLSGVAKVTSTLPGGNDIIITSNTSGEKSSVALVSDTKQVDGPNYNDPPTKDTTIKSASGGWLRSATITISFAELKKYEQLLAFVNGKQLSPVKLDDPNLTGIAENTQILNNLKSVFGSDVDVSSNGYNDNSIVTIKTIKTGSSEKLELATMLKEKITVNTYIGYEAKGTDFHAPAKLTTVIDELPKNSAGQDIQITIDGRKFEVKLFKADGSVMKVDEQISVINKAIAGYGRAYLNSDGDLVIESTNSSSVLPDGQPSHVALSTPDAATLASGTGLKPVSGGTPGTTSGAKVIIGPVTGTQGTPSIYTSSSPLTTVLSKNGGTEQNIKITLGYRNSTNSALTDTATFDIKLPVGSSPADISNIINNSTGVDNTGKTVKFSDLATAVTLSDNKLQITTIIKGSQSSIAVTRLPNDDITGGVYSGESTTDASGATAHDGNLSSLYLADVLEINSSTGSTDSYQEIGITIDGGTEHRIKIPAGTTTDGIVKTIQEALGSEAHVEIPSTGGSADIKISSLNAKGLSESKTSVKLIKYDAKGGVISDIATVDSVVGKNAIAKSSSDIKPISGEGTQNVTVNLSGSVGAGTTIENKTFDIKLTSTEKDGLDVNEIVAAFNDAVAADGTKFSDMAKASIVDGRLVITSNKQETGAAISVTIGAAPAGITGGITGTFDSKNAGGVNVDANGKEVTDLTAATVTLAGTAVTGNGYKNINVKIDGTDHKLQLNAGDTAAQVAEKINTALAGSGTAKLQGSNIVITSGTKGTSSSVEVIVEPMLSGGTVASSEVKGIATAGESASITTGKLSEIKGEGAQTLEFNVDGKDITVELTSTATDSLTQQEIVDAINAEFAKHQVTESRIGTDGNTITETKPIAEAVLNSDGTMTISTFSQRADSSISMTANTPNKITGGVEAGESTQDTTGTQVINAFNGSAVLSNYIAPTSKDPSSKQTLKITVDGNATPIEITVTPGMSADALVAEINKHAEVKAELIGTDIKVTSATTETSGELKGDGTSIKLEMVYGTGGIEQANTATNGEAGTAAVWTSDSNVADISGHGTQKVTVTIDKKAYTTDITVKDGETLNAQQIVDKINATLAANTVTFSDQGQSKTVPVGKAELIGGKLVITAGELKTGTTIDVSVVNPTEVTGGIAAEMTSNMDSLDLSSAKVVQDATSGTARITGITQSVGGAAGEQYIDVSVNGQKSVRVTVVTGDDINKIAEKIQTQVNAVMGAGNKITTSVESGDIVISTETPGAGKTVEVDLIQTTGGMTGTGTPTTGEDGVAASWTSSAAISPLIGYGTQTVTVTIDGTTKIDVEITVEDGKLAKGTVPKSLEGQDATIGNIAQIINEKIKDYAKAQDVGGKLVITRNGESTGNSIAVTVSNPKDLSGGVLAGSDTNDVTDNATPGTTTIEGIVAKVGGNPGDEQYIDVTVNGTKTRVIIASGDDITQIATKIKSQVSGINTAIDGNNIVISTVDTGAGETVTAELIKVDGGVTDTGTPVTGVDGKSAVWTSNDKISDLTGYGTQEVTIKIDGGTAQTVPFKATPDKSVTTSDIKTALQEAVGTSATVDFDAAGKLTITTVSQEDNSSVEVTITNPTGETSGGMTAGTSTFSDIAGTIPVINNQNAKLVLDTTDLAVGGKQELVITTSNGSTNTIVLDASTAAMNISQIASQIQSQSGGKVTATVGAAGTPEEGKLVITATDTAGSGSKIELQFKAGNNASGGIATGTDVSETGDAEIPAKVARLETAAIEPISGTGIQEIRVSIQDIDTTNGTTVATQSKVITLDTNTLKDKDSIASYIDSQVDSIGLDAAIENGNLVITSRGAVTGADVQISLEKLASNNATGGVGNTAGVKAEDAGVDPGAAQASIGIKDMAANGGVRININGTEKTLYFESKKTAQDIADAINSAFNDPTNSIAKINGSNIVITSPSSGTTSNVDVTVLKNDGTGGVGAVGTKADVTGTTKVDPVTAEPAQISTPISNLTGTGNQVYRVSINGKNYDIKVEVENGKLINAGTLTGQAATGENIATIINTKLGVAGTASYSGGNLVIKSATENYNSKVSFQKLETNNATGGVTSNNPITGDGIAAKEAKIVTDVSTVAGTPADGMQHIDVLINGKSHKVDLAVGDDANKIADKINTALGRDGSARIIPAGEPNAGKLEILNKMSASGSNSSVEIVHLPGNNATGGINVGTYNGTPGVDPTPAVPPTYTKAKVDITAISGTGYQDVGINIDGKDYTVRLKAGSTPDDIARTISNTISDKGRAYLENGKTLVVESRTPGSSSTVTIARKPTDPNYNQANAGGIGVGSSTVAGKRSVPPAGELDVDWRGINVLTQKTANRSIGVVDRAVQILSKERSKLGAIQNRLESTIRNLENSSENLQAAEARIRDTDMAKEIANHARLNILSQVQTVMMVHAQVQQQNVLHLFN